MEHIHSYKELESKLSDGKLKFVLLYKNGHENSDCALKNLSVVETDKESVATVDVSEVRDIHIQFNITSAPSLLEFKDGLLVNVIKGCQDKEYYSTIVHKRAMPERVNSNGKSLSVTVYTTPTCTYCNAVKNYFRSNGVSYREIDVSRDQHAATEMVRRSGQQGVPQTLVNGRLVIGFDKKKLDELLEIN
jgi:glutaredoxin-like YruB-family protein